MHVRFSLEPTFTGHTHGGDGVSQARLPPLLPKCPEKPDSYLRVIAMGMGLSRTWLAQGATSFHRFRISLSVLHTGQYHLGLVVRDTGATRTENAASMLAQSVRSLIRVANRDVVRVKNYIESNFVSFAAQLR